MRAQDENLQLRKRFRVDDDVFLKAAEEERALQAKNSDMLQNGYQDLSAKLSDVSGKMSEAFALLCSTTAGFSAHGNNRMQMLVLPESVQVSQCLASA